VTPTLAAAPRAAAPPSPWVVFRLTGVAVFLISLDATVVIAAFPALRTAFGDTSPAALSWVLNAYTIVYAALLVPAGQLADAMGRKRLFLIGLALFTAASLLCGLATGPAMLSGLRVVQAVGAALLTPTSLALILHAFPGSKRSVAVSLWAAVGGLAAAIGPIVGAWLIQVLSWQWVFFINVPIGLAAWYRARSALTEPEATRQLDDKAGRPDAMGIALVTAAVALLALAAVKFADWGAAASMGCAAAGLALFVALRWRARRNANLAQIFSLFEERSFRWVSAATFVFGAAFTMMFLTFFLFLTGVWHYPMALAGLAVAAGPLMVIPVAALAGRLAARIEHRPLLVTGGLLFALTQWVFLQRVTSAPAFLTLWLPSQVLGGVAVGLLLPSLTGAATARLTPGRFGIGSAVNLSIRQIGTVLGAALAVAIAGAVAADLEAFRTTYATLGFLGLATTLLSLPIDTRPRSAGVAASNLATHAGSQKLS
jgi:EmrB/QacA subfamily drug resistance transporter